jgi:tetratricopeptide (TPR) repeat protein
MERLLIENLRSKQADYLQRIKACSTEVSNVEVVVTREFESFCWAMAYKYSYLETLDNLTLEEVSLLKQDKHKKQNLLYQSYTKNFLGKLGEVAVKNFLNDLISNVNYNIDNIGDSGFDFYISDNSEIRIQVRTTTGSFEQVKWSVDKKILERNSVIICVLMQETLKSYEDHQRIKYNLAIGGFIPTQLLREKLENEKITLKTEDLLYFDGLKEYLELILRRTTEGIHKRAGEVFAERTIQLRDRLASILSEFYLLVTEARKFSELEDNHRVISICNLAIEKYENSYCIIGWLTESGLNFYAEDKLLEDNGISHVKIPEKQLLYSRDYEPLLEVYELCGIAKLKEGDFAAAWSDFEIFIILEEHPRMFKDFPLSTQLDASGYIEGYAVNLRNVLVYYNQGCALIGLEKYDRAAKQFERVIEFVSQNRNKNTDVVLAAAYKRMGDILKLENYTKAVEYYNKAVEINPNIAEAIVFENSNKLKAVSTLKIELPPER